MKTTSASFILSVALQFLWCPTSLADPEPLQDHCVADTRASPPNGFFFNGVPCIDPAKAKPSHFATSALSKPGNTRGVLGYNVTLATVANLPGLNTLGLTMARLDFGAAGIIPNHLHPRASEIVFVLSGDLLVGFLNTSNALFTQQLRRGDALVIPKGMVHFITNLGSAPAAAVSGFNSQNPGTVFSSNSAFGARPELPDEVLKAAFRIDGQEVARIRKNWIQG